MTWEEYHWVIVLILFVALFILLDELAYWSWQKANPGALYSHLFEKKGIPLVDPSRPPTTYYG
jgi:hypothetical protein